MRTLYHGNVPDVRTTVRNIMFHLSFYFITFHQIYEYIMLIGALCVMSALCFRHWWVWPPWGQLWSPACLLQQHCGKLPLYMQHWLHRTRSHLSRYVEFKSTVDTCYDEIWPISDRLNVDRDIRSSDTYHYPVPFQRRWDSWWLSSVRRSGVILSSG